MIKQSRSHKWIFIGFMVCLVALLVFPVFAAEKVTLQFMISSYQEEGLKPVVDAFNAKNPDIKVEIQLAAGDWDKLNQKILTSVAAGTAPDICPVQDKAIPAFALRGFYLNLDHYIKTDPEFKKAMNDQVAHSNDPWKMNTKTGQMGVGSQYALSFNGGALVLYYNKTLFDKAGVAYPNANWTWDDFLNAAKKTTVTDDKGRVVQYGLTSSNWWYHDFPTWVWSAGGDFIAYKHGVPTSAFNTPQVLTALKYMQDMVLKYKVAQSLLKTDDMVAAFGSGRTAMYAALTSFVGYIKNATTNYKWEIADWPPINPKAGAKYRRTRSTFDGVAILKSTKHPDQAWKFIKFMAAGEGQQAIAKGAGFQPVLKSVLQSDLWRDPEIPQKANFAGYGSIGKNVPANVMWPQMVTQVEKYYQLMINGDLSPEDAQKQIHVTINNLLNDGQKLIQEMKSEKK